jgi:hypothetical protein
MYPAVHVFVLFRHIASPGCQRKEGRNEGRNEHQRKEGRKDGRKDYKELEGKSGHESKEGKERMSIKKKEGWNAC